MDQTIPWGTKGPCLRALAESLVDAVEREGLIMIGAILSKDFRLVYDPEKGNSDEDRGYRPKTSPRKKAGSAPNDRGGKGGKGNQ